MEMETEHINGKLTTWQPSPRSNEISGWLAEQVTILAEAMGETMTPARLKIYAGDLADLDRSQLAGGFVRARRECRFFPKIAELRELAGANPKQSQDAEMRAAWDIVSKYVSRWGRWNCERDHAYIEQGAPKLSARITDTVRRTGGWSVYLDMDVDDFPFQQKRFFEEYQAWAAVERVDLGHMLTEIPQPKRLTAPAVPAEAKPAKVHTFKPKPIPYQTALTDAQLRDRRIMLKQQIEQQIKRHHAECSEEATA